MRQSLLLCSRQILKIDAGRDLERGNGTVFAFGMRTLSKMKFSQNLREGLKNMGNSGFLAMSFTEKPPAMSVWWGESGRICRNTPVTPSGKAEIADRHWGRNQSGATCEVTPGLNGKWQEQVVQESAAAGKLKRFYRI